MFLFCSSRSVFYWEVGSLGFKGLLRHCDARLRADKIEWAFDIIWVLYLSIDGWRFGEMGSEREDGASCCAVVSVEAWELGSVADF